MGVEHGPHRRRDGVTGTGQCSRKPFGGTFAKLRKQRDHKERRKKRVGVAEQLENVGVVLLLLSSDDRTKKRKKRRKE